MKDSTFSIGSSGGEGTLDSFFQRPVRVAEYTWSVGSYLNFALNAHSVYFNNTVIKSKLNRYSLIRGDLVVRLCMNGTAFHYGRLMASFMPLDYFDDTDQVDHIGTDIDIVRRSQRQHVILNPSNGETAEMHIPYVMPASWYSLVDTANTVDRAGIIKLNSFQTLKHANGGTDPISISVFAWLENVEVAQFTSHVTQSEATKGPVSSIASNAASIARKLKNAPLIGPYMTAAASLSTGVADVARIFGYSRPIIKDKMTVVQQRYMGNMANTDANEAVVRLSLDSNNELTVDPRVVGLKPTDEMDIEHICNIESYLTQFVWARSDPSDTSIFTMPIKPMNYQYTSNAFRPPALCFAAMPFHYWRGTIRVRFQVVCTSFHRGRLRVIYDPHNLAVGEDGFVSNSNTIIDISSETDVYIDFPWAQNTPFRRQVAATPTSTYGFTGTAPYLQENNGTITVQVLNDLTTPDSVANNDVSVNVFISGHDMQFADVSDATHRVTYFNTQSEIVTAGALDVTTSPLPSENDNLMKVYMGEKIVSFRSLLKRYTYHSSESYYNDQVNLTVSCLYTKTPYFPLYYGVTTFGIHQDALGASVNLVNTTLLNYLAPAFVCRRGGLRYKYIIDKTGANPGIGTFGVARAPSSVVSYVAPVIEQFAVSNVSRSQNAWNNVSAHASTTSHAGQHWISLENKGCMEIDVPMYTNERFYMNRVLNTNYGRVFDRSNVGHLSEYLTTHSAQSMVNYRRYVATAEDFSLSYFAGAPSFNILTMPLPQV